MLSVSKIQQESKLDGIPHYVQMKAKLCIVVLEDHGSNIVQEKDNNTNRVDEMTSMLWDIIVSWERKHTWQMVNETWVDDFGLVSIMVCFAWTRKVW